ASEGAPTSALDALFNEREFELYTDESPVAVFVPHSNRSAGSHSAGATEIAATRPAKKQKALRAPRPATPPRGKGGHVSHQQKVLAWVAGALVAVLVLVGLFFLGTRLPAADPVAESTPTPTPSVTASAAPVAPAPPQAPVVPVATTGPVAPGPHAWNELLGTECLQPFVSAWEQEYTVVECGQAHTGQLVYRGRFAESALDPYPGVDGLQARMNPLCATPTNIDYGAASLYSDIQVSASFAGTQEAWAQGNRDYYCFVSRSSGQPFATNVATPPQPIVVIPVVAAPEP
ncbi:MAG: hypothetical protein JWM51_1487, partial [Microbacteriaceae bacterium]|nr:hypothetical protein [Microbacteriaceae bacterium]